MRRIAAALLILAALSSCANLTRTNRMLQPYVGRSIDDFMKERAYAADRITPLDDGGAIYAFHGGPGGPYCRFFFVTSPKRTITSYRFEGC